MARFLKHIPCPKCGSRDNRGVYSDGSEWCFGCHSLTPIKISPYALKALYNTEEDETLRIARMSYPTDATKYFSEGAMAWFKKYEIPIELILKNEVYFSPSKNQVVFGFCDGEGRLLAYQARNLTVLDKGRRYYTKGNINEVLPIYYSSGKAGPAPSSLALVEDCLSAIKIAGFWSDAMPLLGSGIGLSKLTRLRHLYGALNVWLDSNMYHQAQHIAQQAQMLGFKAKVGYSPLDPKCYNEQEIKEYLNDNCIY